MTDASGVKVRVEGPALYLALNRPENGNLINNDMMAALLEALEQHKENDTLKVVVLTGEGDNFCAGRDLSPPPAGAKRPSPIAIRNSSQKLFIGVYRAIKEFPAPVLASVQGRVFGTGCALAAACDVTLAAEDAVFCVPDMRTNVPPLLVMYAMLDRLSKKQLALMAFSAEEMDARTALEYGLINQVVAPDELNPTLAGFIEALVAHKGAPLATIKEFLRQARQMDEPAAVEFSANLLAVVNTSQVH